MKLINYQTSFKNKNFKTYLFNIKFLVNWIITKDIKVNL